MNTDAGAGFIYHALAMAKADSRPFPGKSDLSFDSSQDPEVLEGSVAISARFAQGMNQSFGNVLSNPLMHP